MKKKDKNFYKKPFDSEEFSEISSSNIEKELNEKQMEELAKSKRFKTEFAIYKIK